MLVLALAQLSLAADPEPAWTSDAWRQLYVEASLPDPHLAYTESLGLGFGAGHFYAHDRGGGLAFLEVEGAGVLLTGIGVIHSASYVGYGGDRFWYSAPIDYALLTVGGTAVVVGRVADAITAAKAAHRHAQAMILAAGTPKTP